MDSSTKSDSRRMFTCCQSAFCVDAMVRAPRTNGSRMPGAFVNTPLPIDAHIDAGDVAAGRHDGWNVGIVNADPGLTIG